MAEDWLADVRKYAPDADEAVVKGIERYCGIALRNRDSSLVSFSDPIETKRVRDNFLKKKLALTESDDTLGAAIAAVGERMKADRTKNRVTVYYLLASHFGRLEQFRAATKDATARASRDAGAVALATGLAAAGVADKSVTPTNANVVASDGAGIGDNVAAAKAATGSAAVLSGGLGGHATGGFANRAGNGRPSRFADASVDRSGGGLGWLVWLLLALIFLLFFLAMRSHLSQATARADDGGATVTGQTATTVTTDSATTTAPADGNAMVATDATTAPPAPAGAGAIAGVRDEKPMLTVYFDTGKAAIADGFAAAAAPARDYVAVHPGATLAVSGYNDASGNAAANALLSKNRAKAVQAALVAAGVPAAAVVLEKPADTTAGAADAAEARRVEVTVKP